MLFSLKSLKLYPLDGATLSTLHTETNLDKHQSETQKIASVSISRLRGALNKESIRNLQELGYL